MDSIVALIALSKIPKIGAVLGKQLIAYCGSPSAVFTESPRNLLKIPGIGPHHVQSISTCIPEETAIPHIEYHKKNGNKITHYLSKDYPIRLQNFEDAPLLYYSKGDFDPHASRTVAIVGTRNPTNYGNDQCRKLVNDLHQFDVQIISGLAYGIDAMAHKTANELKLENVAVMGTGMDVIYPAVHRSLAQKITKNGAIISEYPIKMRADKENFPRRNRVIAQLADVIVVIESAQKGGSLITALLGNQYFKDVFAFPGRIGDERSEGCNTLIKQAQAHLLQSARDIAYIMRWNNTGTNLTSQGKQSQLFLDLSDREKQIMKCLEGQKDLTMDQIHHQVQLSLSELAGILLQLEFKGIVTALPGKRFRKSQL